MTTRALNLALPCPGLALSPMARKQNESEEQPSHIVVVGQSQQSQS